MKKFFVLLLILVLTVLALLVFGSQESRGARITVKEVAPFAYCCLEKKGPYTEIENTINQLMYAMQEQNILPTGPLIGIYYSSPDMTKQEDLIWEIGFPVGVANVQPLLVLKEWKYTLVAEATHVGPYEKSAETYAKIFEWIAQNGYVPAGPVMEKYTSDPSTTRAEELRSEIWVPVKKAGT